MRQLQDARRLAHLKFTVREMLGERVQHLLALRAEFQNALPPGEIFAQDIQRGLKHGLMRLQIADRMLIEHSLKIRRFRAEHQLAERARQIDFRLINAAAVNHVADNSAIHLENIGVNFDIRQQAFQQFAVGVQLRAGIIHRDQFRRDVVKSLLNVYVDRF